MKTIFTNTQKKFTGICLLAIALIALGSSSDAQVCANPSATIYSLSNAGGIYPITVSNASVGSLVNPSSYGSSTSANSIGYNTNNGLFYYFQVALSGAKTFVSYDPTTGVYKTLAASPIAATVNRGCVNFDGSGYYCLDVNSNLYYYSIAANSWTLICSVFKDQFGANVSATFTSESSGDMAIDGFGNLWILASNGTQYGLYKLTAPLPTTSMATITLTRVIAPSTSTPGSGFTGIAFDPTGNIYMATTTDLYIMKTGFVLTHIGAFSVAGVSGDLSSCSYPISVLPVIWQSITASLLQDKSVLVSWQVTQQIDDKGYNVERSADGITWDQLGFVENNGDAEIASSYSFTDENPAAGKNYYRISQVDLDGREHFSAIEIVNMEKNASNIVSVWPNPAKDMIHIQNNNEGSSLARIYSLSGALISEHRLQSGINTINVSAMSTGVYVISVQSAGGQSYNKKFIKQ
jgi:hypothetical protein